ncbi:MAG: glycosyl hydrolase family 28 protein [Clostridia bacterium]|nr:glycosyl hydrolase family 28 protein [Clostridia bacterium]
MIKNKLYEVTVNNKAAKLEEIRVSAFPFNRTWPGKQRDAEQSEIAYVLRIREDLPRDIVIERKTDFESFAIRPLSKKIKAERKGSTISFKLEKHGYYAVEFDGESHALYLFFEPKRNFEEYGVPTYSFGAGEHNVGLLSLKSGESVFIDENAVVHGSIYGVDVSDIKIYGYGVLDAGWEDRREKNGDVGWDGEADFAPEKVHTYGGVRFYRSKNIVIDGITVYDPASYAISFFGSENIHINHTKVAGLWKYNNDGIDFFNCRKVELLNSFVRSFDDSVCIKGITAFSKINSEDITVENCVLSCNWGITCEIGLATACDEIKNIAFRNCDLIHNCHVCMDVNNGQWAHVHDVVFENINVEYTRFNKKPVLQSSGEQKYVDSGEVQVPALARVIDGRRNWAGNKAEDDTRCKNGNITFRNISVTVDAEIKNTPNAIIKRCMSVSDFYNIRFENIKINGKEITELSQLGIASDPDVSISTI